MPGVKVIPPPKAPKVKRPRGHQKGKPLSDKHKDAIRATMIMDRLEKAAMGEVEMTGASLKASEIYLSKTVPSLSAVEQTNLNDDVKTPEQMQATLKAMLENPVIRKMLKDMLDEPTVQLVKRES